jgi:pyruvate/2-oxoglutarate dehydrogenase complex dihydrolipoamide dehydrogenase (E3) component
MKSYDAIIIGSGQGGTPLSKKLANKGLKTAIIERRWPGGTCINDGCTPTKTMVASARVAYLAKRSTEFGVNNNGFSVDMKAIFDRKQKVVESFRNSSEKGLRDTKNLELIYGEASFTGHKEITIKLREGGEETMGADKIFLNVGARPSIPKIDGLDTVNYLTSTSIMELKELPEHLIAIGGGYISLEFGQMFRRFGSKVTILEHGDRFLAREDEDVANEIKRILEDEGIEIHTNCQISKVSSTNNVTSVRVKINDEEKNFDGTHLLIGAGRTPNTDVLNPEKAGININERGHIVVNDKLETSVQGIYALGDVKGGPEFTHISYHDHLIIYKNLFENGNESTTGRLVPYCMFTDPQLGRVGITEQEARKKGMNIQVATLPMSHIARAIETGETKGLMKAIVDADSKKILGVAVLGEQGGEMMSMLEIAMMGALNYEVLKTAVFAHPLYAESLNNLFFSLDN